MDPRQGKQQMQLPQRYKHQIQTRTQKQIFLTNELCKIFTQLNLKRVNQKLQQGYNRSIDFKDIFYFICICGIPPFEGQYQSLNLPGDKTVISLSGLMGQYTEQQYMQIFKTGGFENQAKKIRQVVQQKYSSRKIVIIYHSFGTYSLVNYIRLYPDHKISGLIDIGGKPIRFYNGIIRGLKAYHKFTHQQLLQNMQVLHQNYLKDPYIKQAGFMPFKNKYQTIIFLKLWTCSSFQTMFDYMRNLPKVLKLFIYGSKDKIIPQYAENEKVIYYSYQNKLQPQYLQKASQSYKKFYGLHSENVQERFAFIIIGGAHSIHMQKKYNSLIREIILQYLEVLKGIQ